MRVKKFASCGHDASNDLESPCSVDVSHGEVQNKKTDGSCCSNQEVRLSLSLFMEAYGFEVEEELSTMATQYWAEGVWTGTWRHETKRRVEGANSTSADVEPGERTCRSGDVRNP